MKTAEVASRVARRPKRSDKRAPGERPDDCPQQHDADDQFLLKGRECKFLLDEDQSPGDHARVVTEKQAAQSGKSRGQVDEARTLAGRACNSGSSSSLPSSSAPVCLSATDPATRQW